MEDMLKQLMELQKLDSKLIELEALRGDLPQQVRQLENKFNREKEEGQKKKELLIEYQKEKDLLNVEISELGEKEKKYKDQLYQVKSNREYDAVTMELESVRLAVKDKEDRVLELMGFEEEMKQFLENHKDVLARVEEEYLKHKKELQDRMAKTEKDEIYLKDQRDKIAKRIQPRDLSAYSRIARAKNGLAIVPVVRNACGGCFKTLPPQKILEIRTMKALRFCEVCGRILVWDETVSEKS